MANYKYSFQEITENMSRALGRDLPISTKKSIEICNHLRGKKLEWAKKVLEEVQKERKAIPMKRFNRDRGHKRKIGPGAYPKKACSEILRVVKNAEANAQQKGLNTGRLFIRHLSAQKGQVGIKYGRQRGRENKRTHIELVLEEEKPTENEKKGKEKKAGKKERVEKRKGGINKEASKGKDEEEGAERRGEEKERVEKRKGGINKEASKGKDEEEISQKKGKTKIEEAAKSK